MKTVVVLCAILAVAVPAVAQDDSDDFKLGLLVGNSFGGVNGVSTTDLEGTDNDPLLALHATTRLTSRDRKAWISTGIVFGMLNFGRLVSVVSPNPIFPALGDSAASAAGVSPDTSVTRGDARRSLIADWSLNLNFGSHFAIVLNTGFIFDTQSTRETETVSDASGYFFVGPRMKMGDGEGNFVVADLLLGESEVMTGIDIFSRDFNKETFRLRPRLRVDVAKEDSSIFPLTFGMWADLGFADKYGDTYVLYLAKDILRD